MRAAAQALHEAVGLPVRKVPAVLHVLTGGRRTQGALTQDAMRRARGVVGAAYEEWRATVPVAPVVHTDDTGWRVGGEPASLMAFETDTATVYHIRPRHRPEDVQEVIPADDAGVMVTDRGRSDDSRTFEGVDQPTCLAHILRSLDDVLATKRGRAYEFGAQLKALLPDALALWHAHRHGQVTEFQADAAALQTEVSDQLRTRRRNEADHQRLLHELGWHHDRGHLLRFLSDPRIEPTNHRAERALRPAVSARQVSHGSKNDTGAHALAAFTSVVRTLAKSGIGSLVEGLYHLFTSPNAQPVPS